MRYPEHYHLSDLTNIETDVHINGKWVPARPLGLASITNRFRLAWRVFTGQCDALSWPENQ